MTARGPKDPLALPASTRSHGETVTSGCDPTIERICWGGCADASISISQHSDLDHQVGRAKPQA